MRWFNRLKAKWGVTGPRVVLILIVFGCTGFTILAIKKPILTAISEDGNNTIFSILYYVLILPVYNLVLLLYGFLFGQFSFFWEFEKRMLFRILGKKNK